jgi:hypothetical protein
MIGMGDERASEGARPRVVVVGGSGFYGRYVVEDLLAFTEAEVEIVCRRPQRAPRGPRITVTRASLDDVERLVDVFRGASAVVHCAGPFQRLPSRPPPLGPARAAVAAGVPYVDIAEDGAFLDVVKKLAKDATAPVLSGASVSPGFEFLAVEQLAFEADSILSIRSAAAPDTRRHRGDGMFRAMMFGVGQPFTAPRDGSWQQVHGWSEPEQVLFPPPIGRRLVHQVYGMADLELLTCRYGARTVSFKAGTEFAWLNRLLALWATVRARTGLPRRADRLTSLVRALSWLVGRAGDESGGFVIDVTSAHGTRTLSRGLGMSAATEGGRIPALLVGIAVQEILAGRLAGAGSVSLADWIDPSRVWDGLRQRGVDIWWRENAGPWQPGNPPWPHAGAQPTAEAGALGTPEQSSCPP